MTKKEMIVDILKTESKDDKTRGTKWIAYVIGDMAHIGQYRDNGHHYFTHPKHCVNMFYDLVSIEGWIRDSVLAEHDIPYGVVEQAQNKDTTDADIQTLTYAQLLYQDNNRP